MGKKKSYSYLSGGKKSKKKNKKSSNRRSSYKAPKIKKMRPSLDKKEAKQNRKTILSPVDVPKDFRKNRTKCNHAGRLLSVEEYRQMTPNWAAYTPALERIVAKYGQDNVHICGDCYDVLVDRDCVSCDDVFEALTVLYAACNVAVANRRMKVDEIKAIAKLKDVTDEFRPVIDLLLKIEADGSDTSSDGPDPDDLNRNSPFIG